MFYTYVLKEIRNEHFYVGSTQNFKKRLTEHNEGLNKSTRGRKWELHCYFAFQTETLARDFENYLKSGSGRAFTERHFKLP